MNYESTFVVSPELPIDRVEELTTKVVKTIEATKGIVKTVKQFGKRKLAYSVNKFREGNYVYMELSGNGETVNALESFFKFNDSVIRFLTVKIEKKKVVAKSVSKVEAVTAKSQVTEVKQNESTAEQSPLAGAE